MHIEHLVLDGVTLTRRERAALPAVVRRELLALLGAPSEADPRTGAGRPPASPRLDRIARAVATEIDGALPPRGGAPR